MSLLILFARGGGGTVIVPREVESYSVIRGGSDKKRKKDHSSYEKSLIGVAQLESLSYQQRILRSKQSRVIEEIDEIHGIQLSYDDEDDILAILLLLDS